MAQLTEDADGENLISVESVNDGRIRTLAQLVEAAAIDLDIWEIERHVVNKWEVGAKGPDERIVVTPLWQVKVWLVRKQPIPVMPVLSSVNLQVELPEISSPSNLSGWRRLLFLPDPHFGFERRQPGGGLEPFHDRRALDVALQIAQGGHFDEVVWGGDLLDLAEWSDRFLRSPEFYFTTQQAIIEAAWWLGRFRMAGGVGRHYALEGNHDYRMRGMLVKHLLMAYQLKPAHEMQMQDVLSIPRLLGLDLLEIEWVTGYPDARVWVSDYLTVEHGDTAKKTPGTTAGTMMGKGPRSVMFGHCHRREMTSTVVNDRNGERVITAGCPGCLCRVDGVVPGHRKQQGWQQGVGMVHYNGRGDQVFELVPIQDGRAFYRGREVRARRQLLSDDLLEKLAEVSG